jgi:transmembrane 9 superfamily protein 2/4
LIDNLPAATKEKHEKNTIVYHGYRLGGISDNQVYINNYLKLKLSYHKHEE